MADGFSSIADLKVIVDANAEKFHSGLQSVGQALDAFDAKGGMALGGFDKLLDTVGGSVLGFRGKLNLLLTGIEMAVGLYQRFAEQGRDVATQLGVTDEYDALTEAIEGLGYSMKDAAVGAFFAVQGAAGETTASMFAFAGATDQAGDSADTFAQRLLNGVTKAFKEVKTEVDIWRSNGIQTASEMKEVIKGIDEQIAEVDARIAKMRSGELAAQTSIFGYLPRDHMAEAEQRRARLEAEKARLEARAKDLNEHDWSDTTRTNISLLGDEVLALQNKNATLGMSVGEIAEYNAIQRAKADATRRNITLDEDAMKAIREEAAEVRRLTDANEAYSKSKRAADQDEQRAAQRQRQGASIYNNAERELLNLSQRERALTMNAAAAAELNMEERLKQQLQAAGIPLTDDELVKIRAVAAAYGQKTAAVIETTDAMRDMQQIGQTVTSNLQSAFARWADGAKFNVKDMVASILADLAQLQFKNALAPIFGGGSGAGANSGGLFGDLLSAMFGGYREGGGDVQAGRAYVVGEKRPELFIPSTNGRIEPSVGGSGVPSVQITTLIDARGATVDAIAELRTAMAERDARMETDVTRIMQNNIDRRIA